MYGLGGSIVGMVSGLNFVSGYVDFVDFFDVDFVGECYFNYMVIFGILILE